jgi:hypothetical protein
LAAALRAHAVGLWCAEAAVELLIGHGVWLHRPRFVERFVRVQAEPAVVGKTALAWVDWHAAADAVQSGQVVCSAGEGRILLIAASIAKGVPLDLGDAVTGLDAVDSVFWWPAPCWPPVVTTGPPRTWWGWRADDLGGDQAAASSAGRAVAAGAGADAAAWPSGVAAGVAGWQQAVDSAGVDRCR